MVLKKSALFNPNTRVYNYEYLTFTYNVVSKVFYSLLQEASETATGTTPEGIDDENPVMGPYKVHSYNELGLETGIYTYNDSGRLTAQTIFEYDAAGIRQYARYYVIDLWGIATLNGGSEYIYSRVK